MLGLSQPYLAGRENALRKVRNAERVIDRGGGVNPIVITGLRGMGKTALLGYIGDELAQKGWLVVPVARFSRAISFENIWLHIKEDIIRLQPQTLVTHNRKKLRQESLGLKAGGTIGTSGASINGEVTSKFVPGSPVELTNEIIFREMEQLGEVAKGTELRLLFCFDEVQDAKQDVLAVLAEI